MVGGIFSNGYSASTPLMGLVFAAMFIGSLLIGKITTKKIDFDYLAQVLILMGFVACIQLIRMYLIRDIFSLNELYGGGYAKDRIAIGWANSNAIAIIIGLALPFSVYYMAVHKKTLWGLGVTALFILAIILTLSRTMLLIAAPFAALALSYAIFRQKGKSKLILTIAATSCIIFLGVVFLIQRQEILKALSFFTETGWSDRGRLELYKTAWETFLRNPLFGAGLVYSTYSQEFNTFLLIVHNSALQFLMWGGIVGLIAFIFHLQITIISAIKKCNEKRMFLFLTAIIVIAHSLLDSSFFMPPTLIIYMLIIGALENNAIENKGFAEVKSENKKVLVK